MNHTPGPWVVDRNHITTDGGHEIATVSYRQSGYVQANIRLLASAPDLLKAAKRILACEAELTTGDAYLEYRALEAAVAKAEGMREP